MINVHNRVLPHPYEGVTTLALCCSYPVFASCRLKTDGLKNSLKAGIAGGLGKAAPSFFAES